MKRLIALILAVLMIALSIITTGAYDPWPPELLYVMNYFEDYYNTSDEAKPSYNCNYIHSEYYNEWIRYYLYYLVEFTSKTPIDQLYFNRFGDNNEYYEYCEVTNLLFDSGLTVFAAPICDDPEYRPENHDDDFYSIKEMYSTKPEIIDIIIKRQLTDRVGYIGDADGDGEVAILDATVIQRHLAQLDTLDIEYREYACDIDDDGKVDVLDATRIQRKLAVLD